MTSTQSAKDSLVKYDTPILLSEKGTEKDKRKTIKKTTNKLPPVIDQNKTNQQVVEDILNSIIPPRCVLSETQAIAC